MGSGVKLIEVAVKLGRVIVFTSARINKEILDLFNEVFSLSFVQNIILLNVKLIPDRVQLLRKVVLEIPKVISQSILIAFELRERLWTLQIFGLGCIAHEFFNLFLQSFNFLLVLPRRHLLDNF